MTGGGGRARHRSGVLLEDRGNGGSGVPADFGGVFGAATAEAGREYRVECLLRVGAVVTVSQGHSNQDNGGLDGDHVVQEQAIRRPQPGERERGWSEREGGTVVDGRGGG